MLMHLSGLEFARISWLSSRQRISVASGAAQSVFFSRVPLRHGSLPCVEIGTETQTLPKAISPPS